MMYKTQRFGMRGLGGAFDLNTTVVPADNQLVASTSTTGPLTASATAYSKIAPLIKSGPAPLTILKAGTITTLDEAEADPPSGSNMVGPQAVETVPGVVFSEFGEPAVSDSTGTSTASDVVAEVHEDALDPGVVAGEGPLPSGDTYGVTLLTEQPPSAPPTRTQQPRSSGSGWLWALGAVAVVGGVGFFLFRRR